MVNRKLIGSVHESLPYIKQNVIFQWLGLCCSVAVSGLLCAAMASLFLQEFTWPLWITLVGIPLLLVIRYFCIQQASKAALASSALVKKTMREKLFSKLCAIGPGYSSRFSTAEIVQLATEGVEQLETYFAAYIPQLVYALIAPLTLFIVCLFLDWKAALALLICVPLIPASIVAVQKFAKKLLGKYWGQYTRLSDSFLENLQGLTTLKIYEADEQAHQKMNEESENFRKITMRVLIMQLNSISVMDFVAYGGAGLGIAFALSALARGSISPFSALYIILLSAEFFIPMRQLGSYFHISMNGSAAADKMFAILEASEDENRTLEIQSAHPAIEARNLNFSYTEGKPILKDISFSIPPVGMRAFVGKSGSGKSTIAALLTAGQSNYTGVLTIGEVNMNQAEVSSLLEHVCLLTHESVLFEGTIRSNLQMAKPEATDEEMWKALEQARIADYLRTQQGLDTPVLQSASNYSGGQRQRIALARALLFDAPVLILDEATSNIDAESENAIMNCVNSLKKEKSIICISHRLANVVGADEIYVLSNGSIVEKGTHETLAAENGLYRKMWQAQSVYENFAKEEVDE